MQIRPSASASGLIIFFLLHYFSFTQNLGLTRLICTEITLQKILRFACFTVCFGDTIRFSVRLMNQTNLFHNLADCTFTWYMNRNLSGLSFQLQGYVHTTSAICVVPLVLVMNFHHFFNQRFVFPGFAFSFEIIVECLSCNIKCFAIKADFSCDSAVICLNCNKL